MTPGTPCLGAGGSAAVFVGTVTDMSSGSRTVRLRVSEVLSGVKPGEMVEIIQRGGTCDVPFRAGGEYVVYARIASNGSLETDICSRTREVAQAADDIRYLREKAAASGTGEIRVFTAYPGRMGKADQRISLEGGGFRYLSQTSGDGVARFADLIAGEYVVHSEADGDLPGDPKVILHSKGCAEVTLLRTMGITGRVTTREGMPAARVEVQTQSVEGPGEGGVMTDANGRYKISLVRAGRYWLGVNLNRSATPDTPYPRWYHPGTRDSGSATVIDFRGKPESRNYDFVLPEKQASRTIEGIVLKTDGRPARVVRLIALDAAGTMVDQQTAEPDGRFVLRVFADTPYRLHAVWPGDTPADALSAPPTSIEAGRSDIRLRLVLSMAKNSYSEETQGGRR